MLLSSRAMDQYFFLQWENKKHVLRISKIFLHLANLSVLYIRHRIYIAGRKNLRNWTQVFCLTITKLTTAIHKTAQVVQPRRFPALDSWQRQRGVVALLRCFRSPRTCWRRPESRSSRRARWGVRNIQSGAPSLDPFRPRWARGGRPFWGHF